MISHGTAKCVSELGHRITFVDLLRCFDIAQAERASENRAFTANSANLIVRQELDFSLNSFHAILAWDILQHLDPASMRVTIAHLAKIIRPQGVVYCMFHGGSADQSIPLYNCSIESGTAVALREVGRRRRHQELSPRTFESLFPEFREVHFFLKKDSLFEVLIFN